MKKVFIFAILIGIFCFFISVFLQNVIEERVYDKMYEEYDRDSFILIRDVINYFFDDYFILSGFFESFRFSDIEDINKNKKSLDEMFYYSKFDGVCIFDLYGNLVYSYPNKNCLGGIELLKREGVFYNNNMVYSISYLLDLDGGKIGKVLFSRKIESVVDRLFGKELEFFVKIIDKNYGEIYSFWDDNSSFDYNYCKDSNFGYLNEVFYFKLDGSDFCVFLKDDHIDFNFESITIFNSFVPFLVFVFLLFCFWFFYWRYIK